MEIEYSIYDFDSEIFKKGSINGLYEEDSVFLREHVRDIKNIYPKRNFRTSSYLEKKLNREKLAELKKLYELFFEEDCEKIRKTRLMELSHSNFLKMLIIKSLLIDSKTIILNHIDIYFSYKELVRILRIIKGFIKENDKNVIFISNNADCLIANCNYYIIVKNNELLYSGLDISKFDTDSNLINFVKLANEKKANLNFYKDSSDLLKAIYRSVQK